MIKRKYVVLSLLTLVSIVLGGLLYCNLVQASPTVKGYVSISAVEFVARDSTFHVMHDETRLYNYEDTGIEFFGSVQLPHGATVTSLTTYWYDSGPGTIPCMLDRCNQTSHYGMAAAYSSGEAGHGSTYTDTISHATVDNSKYTYSFYGIIPSSVSHTDYYFEYAIIEYTLPSEEVVGGFWIPVDKLGLLSPYIALVSTIILATAMSIALIKYRKKQ